VPSRLFALRSSAPPWHKFVLATLTRVSFCRLCAPARRYVRHAGPRKHHRTREAPRDCRPSVVEVVRVEWIGSDALNVVYRGSDGPAEVLLFREAEPRLELVQTSGASVIGVYTDASTAGVNRMFGGPQ
jgi:hypothetical protein